MNVVARFEQAAGDAEDAAYEWCASLHALALAERYGYTVHEWLALRPQVRGSLTFAALHAEPALEDALEDAQRWTERVYLTLARRLSLELIAERAVAGDMPALEVPEVPEVSERLAVSHEREHAPPIGRRVSTCPRSPHGPPLGAGYLTALGGAFRPLGETPPP